MRDDTNAGGGVQRTRGDADRRPSRGVPEQARAALGAEIKLTVRDDGAASRTIFRTVGDTSSFGANPMEQHIGLGHGARIISLDVWWPASNTRQHFSQVDKNEFIAIKEFATAYTKLDRKPYRLGAKAIAAAK